MGKRHWNKKLKRHVIAYSVQYIGKRIHYLNSKIFWCDSMKYLLINKNIKMFIPGNNILIHRIQTGYSIKICCYIFITQPSFYPLYTPHSVLCCAIALYRFFIYIYIWAGQGQGQIFLLTSFQKFCLLWIYNFKSFIITIKNRKCKAKKFTIKKSY